MIEIKNKEEVLERIKKLYRKQNYRLSCEFCAGSSYNFAVAPVLIQIDGQAFVQFFCKRCGYTMLLNYNILMEEKEATKKKSNIMR